MKNKISLIQTIPGSWSSIDILVGGEKKFVACKSSGPGWWQLYHSDGQYMNIGGASTKTEIKTKIREYLENRE